MKSHIAIHALIALLAATPLCAAEYFLGVNGNDKHPGNSETQALATLASALRTLLPGDTLTILPGEYHQEAHWVFPGSDKTLTTIRAKIPGTVHFRGDTPAPKFQPAATKNVHVCTVETMPQQILERDTLTKYTSLPSELEVSFTPGSCFLDHVNKKVYIHTTDSADPASHHVTFSMLRGNALRITGSLENADTPVNGVVIDGLTFSGYNANSPLADNNSTIGGGGIYIRRPVNSAIRDCTVYLCGDGIVLRQPKSTDIDDCRCYYNDNDFQGSGGNIICYNPTLQTRIRRCAAFGSRHSGIRMYGGTPAENSLIEDCVVFDNDYGDIWIKYPSDTSVARRCYSGHALHSRLIENSIFSSGDGYYFGKASNSIVRSREKSFKPDEQFADPGHFDFRPQSDSVFRNPERGISPFDSKVLFVSPSGKDSADGNSVSSALKSFKAAADKLDEGGTLYILPGKYSETLKLSGKNNILIRGRGNDPVFLNGGITLEDCHNATCENLILSAPARIGDSNKFTLKNCAVKPPIDFSSKQLRLINNTFAAPVTVAGNDAEIRANIFAAPSRLAGLLINNSFTDNVPSHAILSFQATPQFDSNDQLTLKNAAQFDGRAIDGMPVGRFRRIPVYSGKTPEPALNSLSSTTANFSLFSPDISRPVLTVGENRVRSSAPGYFHTLSLSGLKPATRYEYRLNAELSPVLRFTTAASRRMKPFQTGGDFTTPASDQPTIWHVAINGDNQASGLSKENAWRDISHAVLKARAGDTILIHGGHYLENVRVGVTGDKGKRLVITAAPGEKVFLDGGTLLSQGFIISGKNYVSIDNIRFTSFRNIPSIPSGGIVADNCPELIISRCLYDGRQPPRYAPPFINARDCANLLMENCVIIRGFRAFSFVNCKDLEVRHNVFLRNQVYNGNVSNSIAAPAWFHHNIWAGHDLQKTHNPVMTVEEAASFREDHNCFMVRLPEELKPIFGINRDKGVKLPQNNDMNPLLITEWRRQGRFGNDMRSYPEFCQRYQRPHTALFVDAGMRALPFFLRFNDVEDWHNNYIKGKASGEQKAAYRRSNLEELSLDADGSRKELDFPDFFATNPDVIKHGGGLRPEAFKSND